MKLGVFFIHPVYTYKVFGGGAVNLFKPVRGFFKRFISGHCIHKIFECLMKHLILFGLCLFLPYVFFAQNTIHLKNPSFEDVPRKAQAPNDWSNCGFASETPPDVQPGSFDVKLPAKDGKTYLGMVVRDNNSWESVGQYLEAPLLKDNRYTFTIWLARSDLYISLSKATNGPANYTTPVKLLIWGGNAYCEKIELLASSGLVTNLKWKPYTFEFLPLTGNFKFLMLEAYYTTPIFFFPYCGNLLLDNCSPIKQIPLNK